MQLAEFDFELKHIKGTENVVAGYLSRQVETSNDVRKLQVYNVESGKQLDYEDELDNVVKALQHLEFPQGTTEAERRRFWKEKVTKFALIGDYLNKVSTPLRKVPYR